MSINRSMPPAAIIPELPYLNVRDAVSWLCNTFGFRERLKIGDHRAQLQFKDGALIVIQGKDPLPSNSIMVRVEDVDSHYQTALINRAQITSSPANFPYGERQYTVKDPAGHRWTFSQTIADVDPSTWGGQLFE